MNNKCEECGAYHGHSPSCSQATREELLKAYLWTQEQWRKEKEEREYWIKRATKESYRQKREADKEVVFWQGKYLMVKTENNALRKKISPQNDNKNKTQQNE